MAELQALTLVDNDALQVVDLGLVHAIDAQLFGKGNSVLKFLLLEGLRIYSESLEVHQEQLRIVADHDFLGCDLPRVARFAQEFIVLVQQLLHREALHAVYQRRVLFDVQR